MFVCDDFYQNQHLLAYDFWQNKSVVRREGRTKSICGLPSLQTLDLTEHFYHIVTNISGY
jgi:hypothetical protein